jgi:hypothetical protein
MEPKKRLILRLALGCAALLAVSLAAVGASTLVEGRARSEREAESRARREAAVERSRKYLAEMGKRVTTLPVDPAVLGEIEARYFEEYPRGRMHVWAMGREGEFLFGVPRETFSKLNAIYDRDVLPRLEDGVYLDRQTFLRGLVEESEAIDAETFAAPEETGTPEDSSGEKHAASHEGPEAAWKRFAHRGDDPDRFVLSTPLRSAEGQALGSLYLLARVEPSRAARNDLEIPYAVGQVGAFGVGLGLFGLWMLLPTWVFVDARGRGVRRAALFAFLTALSAVIGLVVYLIARPEDPRTLPCPGCGREVDGHAYCPHCGRDLSTAFCPACRYPLKPDWVYCPACRSEIKAPAQPQASAGAAEAAS